MLLACKRSLTLAVQMEAVSQPLFEVPYAVDDAVDWPNDVISHWWDAEREFADPSEFREQAFGVEEPWIRQLLGRDSLWRVHTARTWIYVFHQGTAYDFI
jgi:hypothetical protein